MDKYQKEIEGLREQMADIADQLKELASQQVDKAEEAGNGYLDSAQVMAQKVGKQVKKAGKQFGAYAQDNPWQVAAVTAGVGAAVLAFLMMNRNRD